jgi:hypothetical protein
MKILPTLVAIAASMIVAGCPLPYEYNGKGASSHSTDPSSPNMTAPVTITYSEEGGGSGSIPDGGLSLRARHHRHPVHRQPQRGHLLY